MTARRAARTAAALLCSAAALGSATGARADVLLGHRGYCDTRTPPGAGDKDRLLRWAAVVKGELERSGATVALIARSGLDLDRFGARYSHAGITLKASPEAPWAVRQLYYACDEGRPRLYDQGIGAFVLGADAAAPGYVSLLFVPPSAAADLERTALDRALALKLLGSTYSANAYAYSVRYQNCNQWVAELLASAWGAAATRADADARLPGPADADPRRLAQAWLLNSGYEPAVFDVPWLLARTAAIFVPWVHEDDHPQADAAALRFRVSMPSSIEAFVRATLPDAERVEICHDGRHVVVHRGWEPVAAGCVPGPGDEVVALD